MRKDNTLVRNSDGKITKEKQEHFVVIKEPGGEYLGHLAPESSKANEIHKEMQSTLFDLKVDLKSIKAVGCNGAAINTWVKNSLVRKLEVFLKRPL